MGWQPMEGRVGSTASARRQGWLLPPDAPYALSPDPNLTERGWGWLRVGDGGERGLCELLRAGNSREGVPCGNIRTGPLHATALCAALWCLRALFGGGGFAVAWLLGLACRLTPCTQPYSPLFLRLPL